jgi:hypothetical protein
VYLCASAWRITARFITLRYHQLRHRRRLQLCGELRVAYEYVSYVRCLRARSCTHSCIRCMQWWGSRAARS